MRKTLLPLLALLAVPSAVAAQEDDWREELSSEQIVIRDSMYTYEEYGIVEIQFPGFEPAKFQVKLSSEAPADGTISRDNFVAITSTTETVFLLAAFAEAYDATMTEFLDAFDYTELDAPIGTPDYELNLRMTDEGMQLEFLNTATRDVTRIVQTWKSSTTTSK